MLELLVDNDVAIKYAEYELLEDLGHFGCALDCTNETAVLDALRFVALRRLQRHIDRGLVPSEVLEAFEGFLARTVRLEPTDEELQRSAELEEWALLAGEPLDSGESQLFAVAASRTGKVLTGDKRAIRSAETAIAHIGWLALLEDRVACLEQSIAAVTDEKGAPTVREHVCNSRSTDMALSLSFSCSAPERNDDFDPVGLTSYIDAVRTSAPTLLTSGYLLTL